MDQETKIAAAKMSAAIGGTIFGITLNDWVLLVTLIYVLLQIGLLVPKYWELIVTWIKGNWPCSKND